jgi:hypothetical protein
LDHQRLILNVDNSALKQRIAALAQDKLFKDGINYNNMLIHIYSLIMNLCILSHSYFGHFSFLQAIQFDRDIIKSFSWIVLLIFIDNVDVDTN